MLQCVVVSLQETLSRAAMQCSVIARVRGMIIWEMPGGCKLFRIMEQWQSGLACCSRRVVILGFCNISWHISWAISTPRLAPVPLVNIHPDSGLRSSRNLSCGSNRSVSQIAVKYTINVSMAVIVSHVSCTERGSKSPGTNWVTEHMLGRVHSIRSSVMALAKD